MGFPCVAWLARIYISNQCLRRIKSQLYDPKYLENNKNLIASINSYLGLFTHYKSNNIKKSLFLNLPKLLEMGEFNDDFTKFEEIKKQQLFVIIQKKYVE